MRKAVVASALSVALLAVAASSASAVTFSPTSIDFGRQPRETKSPPRTFTLTKESQFSVEEIEVRVTLTGDFFNDYWGTNNCPGALTATTPSCTVTLYYTPLARGQTSGIISTTRPEASAGKATASFTGGPSTKPCTKKKQRGRTLRYKKRCRGFQRVERDPQTAEPLPGQFG